MFPTLTSPRDREGHRFVSFIVPVSLTVQPLIFSHYNENRWSPFTLSSRTARRDSQMQIVFIFSSIFFFMLLFLINHAHRTVSRLGLRQLKKKANRTTLKNNNGQRKKKKQNKKHKVAYFSYNLPDEYIVLFFFMCFFTIVLFGGDAVVQRASSSKCSFSTF